MNKKMIIEKVINNQQIEIVEKLADEIWNQHFIPIIGKAQVDYMLEKYQSKKALLEQIKKGFLYYLIKTDNGYIGYFGVLPKKETLFLSKFYIKFSEQRKGFGKKIILFIEDLAKEKGVFSIILTVNKYNTGSIKAYEKMGFKNVESIIQDIGNGYIMDDYKLQKNLKN